MESFKPQRNRPRPSQETLESEKSMGRREFLTGAAAVGIGMIAGPEIIETEAKQVREIEALKGMFPAAEKTLEAKGREAAKPLLGPIYSELQRLNRSDTGDWKNLWVWNKEGDLTEAAFAELNLLRMKLSNAIGMMTASGVRHDIYKI